jgi:hypothetical protein
MRVIVEQLVERTTIAGETEVLGENLPQRHFVPPQIPHDQVRVRTPDRSGGKPATNHLSNGAAMKLQLVSWKVVGLTAAKFKPLILYAWLLLVQYHIYLDLHGLGLNLPVFCVI